MPSHSLAPHPMCRATAIRKSCVKPQHSMPTEGFFPSFFVIFFVVVVNRQQTRITTSFYPATIPHRDGGFFMDCCGLTQLLRQARLDARGRQITSDSIAPSIALSLILTAEAQPSASSAPHVSSHSHPQKLRQAAALHAIQRRSTRPRFLSSSSSQSSSTDSKRE